MIKILYDRILRPFLPRKIGMYAGIGVRKPRLFDSTDSWPNHAKRRLIKLTRDAVSREDRVIIIGGGEGFSPTAAAQAAGPDGHVKIFEASQEYVDKLDETLELNAVRDQCSIQHAIVGEALDVMGELGHPDVVDPANLPSCDVLQLDCEGAEIGILNNINIQPDKVVVETHPRFDAPTNEVMEILSELGYDIQQSVPEPVSGDILLATQ